MITIEFYGIPRLRSGVARAVVMDEQPRTLGELWQRLAIQYPRFASDCLIEDRLQSHYIANLNGERFVEDPHTLLPMDACVLVLSADAGG